MQAVAAVAKVKPALTEGDPQSPWSRIQNASAVAPNLFLASHDARRARSSSQVKGPQSKGKPRISPKTPIGESCRPWWTSPLRMNAHAPKSMGISQRLAMQTAKSVNSVAQTSTMVRAVKLMRAQNARKRHCVSRAAEVRKPADRMAVRPRL